MKKLILFLLSITVACGISLFCACGGGDDGDKGNGGTTVVPDDDKKPGDDKNDPEVTLSDFTGITFTDKEVTYDGNEHAITVSGTVPEGADVVYTNNKGTNAGEYNASVTISKDNYNSLTLNAKLTIAKASFTGITFTGDEVTYDGSEHAITVSGTVPEGADVVYTNNKGTNAGEYNASVTISKDNYNSLTLNAKLTIKKAKFAGIIFKDKITVSTGTVHSLEVEGELPEGTTVKYENNDQKDAGEYTVKATVTNPNYEDLVLEAKLKIISIPAVAKDIVTSLLNKPDPWSFLPEALSESEMAYNSAPVSDFTSFVNVSAIGDRIIGKQLHVLYEGLIDTATALGFVDTAFAVIDAIAGVYQTFINDNPENYASFTGEAAGFKLSITLDGDKSEIILGNSAVSMELTYDKSSGTRIGRIQLTDGIAVKYQSGEDSLKIAVKATVAGVGNLKQIEFVREDDGVAGYLYEYTGTATKNLKTSAVIVSDANYTRIMSNKRETDDLVIKGYEEVYSSKTGKYIGGEVRETVKSVNFDTLWFMLNDVSGFNTVKVSSEQNELNADTVYVNGASAAFVAKKVGGLSLKTASRRYDIEMKEVWYVVAVKDGDKVKYDTVKNTIPMLFVQIEQTDSFGSDVKKENSNEFAAEPALPDYTAVNGGYEAMQALFDTIKELVTYEEIDSFIGEKNSFTDNK